VLGCRHHEAFGANDRLREAGEPERRAGIERVPPQLGAESDHQVHASDRRAWLAEPRER
jgi:hypothetical protein